MVYLVVAGIVFVTDLFIKNRIEKSRKLGETEEICKGRILLTKYYNRGAATGIYFCWRTAGRHLCKKKRIKGKTKKRFQSKLKSLFVIISKFQYILI